MDGFPRTREKAVDMFPQTKGGNSATMTYFLSCRVRSSAVMSVNEVRADNGGPCDSVRNWKAHSAKTERKQRTAEMVVLMSRVK